MQITAETWSGVDLSGSLTRNYIADWSTEVDLSPQGDDSLYYLGQLAVTPCPIHLGKKLLSKMDLPTLNLHNKELSIPSMKISEMYINVEIAHILVLHVQCISVQITTYIEATLSKLTVSEKSSSDLQHKILKSEKKVPRSSFPFYQGTH